MATPRRSVQQRFTASPCRKSVCNGAKTFWLEMTGSASDLLPREARQNTAFALFCED